MSQQTSRMSAQRKYEPDSKLGRTALMEPYLILKFVSNLKARRDKSRSAPGELSSEEISEARKHGSGKFSDISNNKPP